MAATARYATVAIVRMQINGFTDNPDVVNTNYHIIVDMENHPQKDEVDINWYYDELTNTFSETPFPTYYYVHMNDANIVLDVFSTTQEIEETGYMEISESVYEAVAVGMVYYNNAFMEMAEANYRMLLALTAE